METTKYKIRSWGHEIEKVQITSETKSFVTLKNGRRESNSGYFNSWAEARQAIINREAGKVAASSDRLASFMEDYNKSLAIPEEENS